MAQMLTQTLNTQAINTQIKGRKIALAIPFPTNSARSPAISASSPPNSLYRKEEEIYGEDEPAEYVYQGRYRCGPQLQAPLRRPRPVGSFHLAGDVFGLESGPAHRLAAEAIIDTTVRLVKRASLEKAPGTDVRVRPQALGH